MSISPKVLDTSKLQNEATRTRVEDEEVRGQSDESLLHTLSFVLPLPLEKLTWLTLIPVSATPDRLYERKSLLVDEELNKMGLGRYQICIWFLCGFGYMLDLMWAGAFGLISTPIFQELNITGGAQTDISTAFSAGLAGGALFWGLMVDIIGRKWSFNLTCLIASIFGTLVAAPSNYGGICALSAFCGFGLGGNVPIDSTIVLEYLPQNRRWLLVLLSSWQPAGLVINAAIAFGLVPKYRCDPNAPTCAKGDNMGWRYLMIVLGAITLTVFLLRFVVFTFHESPKFLLARGRDEEAILVIQRVAAFNRQPVPTLTLADLKALDDEYVDNKHLDDSADRKTAIGVVKHAFAQFKHLKGLFKNRSTTVTIILLLITYAGDFWSFTLAGSFLPIILARAGQDANQSVAETYRQYIYIDLPGILGTVIGAAMIEVPGLGRKWSLVLGAVLQGVAMALFTQAKTIKAQVGLNAFEYVMQSLFNAILYGFTPEVFPAPFRGSAAGLCSSFGRVSSIIAPIAARPYIDGNSDGVLWLACGGIWLAAVVLVFLPVETRKRANY
ncbi:hypothetical protein MNV49_001716 [Pseudohyphozyma bogoriensis]|nr:hypothetical protein MNV49_001716 [Pseudohyphozyma bogoriensis]